jgi:hypothetical protein
MITNRGLPALGNAAVIARSDEIGHTPVSAGDRSGIDLSP